MADDQYDMTLMKQVRDYATQLTAHHSARISMQNKMEEIFLMQWANESKATRAGGENTKATRHPDARNKLLGAVRLLVAADPDFSVPKERNNQDVMENADIIEKWATQCWWEAGRVRKRPVHYDSVLSMLLFGETHTVITRTQDMVEYAKGANPGALARAEKIARCTPYLFDVYDPRTGYPDIGPLGLNAYYREVQTTSGKVLDDYGSKATDFFPDGNRYQPVTLAQFWDLENRIDWINAGGSPGRAAINERPLIQETNDLGFIPVDVQLGEGSTLFDLPEEQRQPFLYTLWKSELWERQNLMLTVYYHLVRTIGLNPQIVAKLIDPNAGLNVDFSVPGGVWKLGPNESVDFLGKRVIDPSVLEGMQIANDLVGESTIYSQALGEPLGANAAFSMVALLHQAGRLPLIVPQRMSSWGIADAVKIALNWYRNDPPEAGDYYASSLKDLAPEDIPEYFELSAKLDVDLPQDQLQQAQIGAQLTQGDNPLVSNEWVLENILGVGQPSEMRRAIWRERFENIEVQRILEQLVAMAQQAQQGGAPPQGGPNGQPPQQGMAPNQEALMQQMAQGQGGAPPMTPPPAPEQIPPEGL